MSTQTVAPQPKPTIKLTVDGLRDPGNELIRCQTKAQAAKEIRRLHLGPEVEPVKAHTRFGWTWMVWATPLGDPGEARLLLTHDGLWVKLCAVGCENPAPALRYCPGHPTDRKESLELTVAICGHLTRIISFGVYRPVECFDWKAGRAYTDHVPAGSMHRAACLCGWQSDRSEARRVAVLAAAEHSGEKP